MEKSLSYKTLFIVGVVSVVVGLFIGGVIGEALGMLGSIVLIFAVIDFFRKMRKKAGGTKELLNKIKKIFIVNREELREKWWHRLANVLIIGSTVIWLIFLVSEFIEEVDYWMNYRDKIPFGVVLESLGGAILFSVGWFIFWESIVYRVVVYIIYGKKK